MTRHATPAGPTAARPGPASVDDLLGRVHVVALPMRVRFRGLTTREVALVEGPAGWGEFGAFTEYDDPDAAWWLASALEMAWPGPPPALRRRVPVNATVPDVEPGRVPEVLESFPGCRTVKVKVAAGGDDRDGGHANGLDDDLARVAAVLEARPGVKIRVDANGGWDVDQAFWAAGKLDALCREHDAELEYIEQPCRTVQELVDLRKRLAAAPGTAASSGTVANASPGSAASPGPASPVPVAADESIRRADDPERVVRAGGADRAVVKAPPLGGPRRLLRIAEGLGVPVTISSALDSAVGMGAGLAAAAALPGPDPSLPDVIPACGLGTGGFFYDDVTAPGDRPRIVDGHLDAGVVTPDPDRLDALAVAGGRRDWWLERIRRCYGLLVSEGDRTR